MHWHKPARPGRRGHWATGLRLAAGQGWAQVLTGAASQAHALGSSDVVLATAIGGLGAVWGNCRQQWGQCGACREGQGLRHQEVPHAHPGPALNHAYHLHLPQPSPLSPPEASSHWGLGGTSLATGEDRTPLTRTCPHTQDWEHTENPKVTDTQPHADTCNQRHMVGVASLQMCVHHVHPHSHKTRHLHTHTYPYTCEGMMMATSHLIKKRPEVGLIDSQPAPCSAKPGTQQVCSPLTCWLTSIHIHTVQLHSCEYAPTVHT